jgi:prepilin-type processing-associated H-X9-DG protein
MDLETDGAFYLEVGRKLKEFTDGLSKTAFASELLAGRLDDAPLFETDHRGRGVMPYEGGGSYCHKTTPNSSVPDRMPYCCISSEDMPCEVLGDLQNEYFAARSWHPGGVNVLFGDGHVEFHVDTVDLAFWRELATIQQYPPVAGAGSRSYPHAISRWDGRHECRFSVWRGEYVSEVVSSCESGSVQSQHPQHDTKGEDGA